jgi:hypothetical protein
MRPRRSAALSPWRASAMIFFASSLSSPLASSGKLGHASPAARSGASWGQKPKNHQTPTFIPQFPQPHRRTNHNMSPPTNKIVETMLTSPAVRLFQAAKNPFHCGKHVTAIKISNMAHQRLLPGLIPIDFSFAVFLHLHFNCLAFESDLYAFDANRIALPGELTACKCHRLHHGSECNLAIALLDLLPNRIVVLSW